MYEFTVGTISTTSKKKSIERLENIHYTFIRSLLELLVVSSLLNEVENSDRQLRIGQRVGFRVHSVSSLQRTKEDTTIKRRQNTKHLKTRRYRKDENKPSRGKLEEWWLGLAFFVAGF